MNILNRRLKAVYQTKNLALILSILLAISISLMALQGPTGFFELIGVTPDAIILNDQFDYSESSHGSWIAGDESLTQWATDQVFLDSLPSSGGTYIEDTASTTQVLDSEHVFAFTSIYDGDGNRQLLSYRAISSGSSVQVTFYETGAIEIGIPDGNPEGTFTYGSYTEVKANITIDSSGLVSVYINDDTTAAATGSISSTLETSKYAFEGPSAPGGRAMVNQFAVVNMAVAPPSAPGAVTVTCGQTITEDTLMANDLDCASGNGLNIGADNIVLNCDGHTISGVRASNSNGIYGDGRNYVTIKNCIVTNFSDYGIILQSTSNSNILSNTVYNNGGPTIMLYYYCSNNLIDNNTVHDSSNGIFIENHGSYNTISNNHAYNNGQYGIALYGSNNNVITNNIVTNNSARGIYLPQSNPDNIITYNTVDQNGGWAGEGVAGIYIASSGITVNYNKIYNNVGYDLRVDSGTINNDFTKNYWNNICLVKLYGIANSSIVPYYMDAELNNLNTHVPTCLGGTPAEPPAETTVTCGQNINESIVIANDLNCSSGHGLNISADNVTLDCGGHTILGVSGSGNYGVYDNNFDNVTIKNCNITKFYGGIYLYGVNYGTVYNNTASGNGQYGLSLEMGFNNSITSNTFSKSNTGVYVVRGSNTFINNTANNNTNGIQLYLTNNSIIVNNTFSNNYYQGFYVLGSNNIIRDNIAKENSDKDFYVDEYAYSCNNIIENNIGSGDRPIKYFNSAVNLSNEVLSELILCDADNSNINNVTIIGSDTMKNNGLFAYYVDDSLFTNINSSHNNFGIYISHGSNNDIIDSTVKDSMNCIYLIYNSSNNSLSGNTLSNCYYGVNIHIDSNNNNLTNNNASYNTNGIDISMGSKNNILDSNTFTNNNVGVYFYESSSNTLTNNIISYNTNGTNVRMNSNNNVFNKNMLYNNTNYAVWNDISSIDNNFTYNYWGSNVCKVKLAGIANSSIVPYYIDAELTSLNTNVPPCLGGTPVAVNVTCGQTITENTIMANDLDCSSGNGLNIGANNVVLDCNGHTLSSSSSSGTGIYFSNYDYVTIKNCVITDFNKGISIDTNADYTTIANNTIRDTNDVGIQIHTSSNVVIANNTVANNANIGIFVYWSPNNMLYNNTVNNNDEGIYIQSYSNYNTLSYNTVYDNNYGFYISQWSDNNELSYNKVYGNTNNDVYQKSDSVNNNIQYSYWGSNVCDVSLNGIAKDSVVPYYSDYELTNLVTTVPPCLEVPLACGNTITTSKTLTEDFNCQSSNGFTIGADNIVLDCGGHTISGSGNYYGIENNGFDNVTVKNCIINYFSESIFFYNYADNGTIDNNVVDSSVMHGIFLANSDSSHITNNIVSNGPYGCYGGIVVGGNSDYNIISNNNVYNNRCENYGAIWLVQNNNNVIANNIITNNLEGRGIQLETCTNTDIIDNTVSNNSYGIYMYASSNNNIINQNKIYDNTRDVYQSDSTNNNLTLNYWGTNGACGAKVSGIVKTDLTPYYTDYELTNLYTEPLNCPFSCGDAITESKTLTEDLNCPYGNGIIISANNIVLDCNGHSIIGPGSSYYGIYNYGYDNVTIKNCNITGFNYGVYFYDHVYYGTITNNTVNSNSLYGIFLDSYSQYNTITDNTANNNHHGIHLYTYSSNNIVTDNTANNNIGAGIYIQWRTSYNTISDNTINNNMYGIGFDTYCEYNNVTDNTASNNNYGINIAGSSNNIINYNEIYSNTQNDVRQTDSTNNNLTLNYWGTNGACGKSFWCKQSRSYALLHRHRND